MAFMKRLLCLHCGASSGARFGAASVSALEWRAPQWTGSRLSHPCCLLPASSPCLFLLPACLYCSLLALLLPACLSCSCSSLPAPPSLLHIYACCLACAAAFVQFVARFCQSPALSALCFSTLLAHCFCHFKRFAPTPAHPKHFTHLWAVPRLPRLLFLLLPAHYVLLLQRAL